MVLLRFTKLISQVRNHNKIQTMRKPRKRPFKVGDKLQVYVIEKLGDAKLTSINRKKLRDITLDDALKDGFKSIFGCQKVLMRMHKCDLDQEFDIIEYKPFWSKQKVMSEVEIASMMFASFGKTIYLNDKYLYQDTFLPCENHPEAGFYILIINNRY